MIFQQEGKALWENKTGKVRKFYDTVEILILDSNNTYKYIQFYFNKSGGRCERTISDSGKYTRATDTLKIIPYAKRSKVRYYTLQVEKPRSFLFSLDRRSMKFRQMTEKELATLIKKAYPEKAVD